jgi:quinol monooxygenase YgiN
MNFHWSAQSGSHPMGAVRNGVFLIARAEAHIEDKDRVEALLQDLADDIRTDEPGCLSYNVTRSLGSHTHFAVHARFENMRAFQRHGLTRHMKRTMADLKARLATPVSLEVFLEV